MKGRQSERSSASSRPWVGLIGCVILAVATQTTPRAHAQKSGKPAAPGYPETQSATAPAPKPAIDAPTPQLTFFKHPDTTRYLISGQTNIIFQAHAPFHSSYQSTYSLLPRGEYKTSLIGTLFLGYQLRRNPQSSTDVILNIESSGGRGISEALGLAGFTNLDVVRNPTIGSKPYIARVQLHQVIGLSKETIDSARTPFSLSTKTPVRRLDLRAGRITLPDFLDTNAIGTDSHLQFLNWTADNNGAYDYAADTRGYTYAAIAEYDDHAFAVRYAIALMPTIANGIKLDWNLKQASGQNLELEYDRGLGTILFPSALPKRKGAVRVLGYLNRANMGRYRDQNIAAVRAHVAPDITAHTFGTTVKYGVGLNTEQELTDNLRVFGRFGWNEGAHESYAYTEVDQTFAAGADYQGRQWHRPNDKVGLAFISNAIKRDHQAYLRLGGFGFLLGDGNLTYAREDIVESYYNLHAYKGLFFGLDTQFIEHPGYNRDRGPVLVESVRMHIDF